MFGTFCKKAFDYLNGVSRTVKAFGLAVFGALFARPAMAQATAPLDMSSITSDLVTWISAAAAAGLGIYLIMIAIKLIIRAFGKVAR